MRSLVPALLVVIMLAVIVVSVITEIGLVDAATAATVTTSMPTSTPGCVYVDPSPAASDACGYQALQQPQSVTGSLGLPPGCYFYDRAYPLPDTCGLPPDTPTQSNSTTTPGRS